MVRCVSHRKLTHDFRLGFLSMRRMVSFLLSRALPRIRMLPHLDLYYKIFLPYQRLRSDPPHIWSLNPPGSKSDAWMAANFHRLFSPRRLFVLALQRLLRQPPQRYVLSLRLHEWWLSRRCFHRHHTHKTDARPSIYLHFHDLQHVHIAEPQLHHSWRQLPDCQILFKFWLAKEWHYLKKLRTWERGKRGATN